jgi:hypothetical protein
VQWLQKKIDQARERLHRQYYQSWHQVQANPEAVRMKAAALDDLAVAIKAELREVLRDE